MISQSAELAGNRRENTINQKPTVMITTYSECHSKFRFGRIKQQRQRRINSNNNCENNKDHQSSENDAARNEQGEDDEEEEEVETATKSENSTDFFNQLKRSQKTRQNNRIVLDLSQIKGPTGSIRGHKDVVRKSLEEIKVASSRRRLMFNLNSNFNSLSTFVSSTSTPLQISSGNYYYPFSLTSSSGAKSTNNSLSAHHDSATDSSATANHHHQQQQQLSFDNDLFRCEYLERLIEDEQNCCVAYTTTLGVIRRTYEDSKLMKSILNLNLIKYEERDIYLNQEYKFQLKIRCDSIIVPALFVDGQYIGGAKEVELANENGALQKDLSKFKLASPRKDVCLCCGNAKFIACPSCNGSRKSAIHHFKYNSIALRCIKCDKNDGLVQCPRCHSQQSFNNCDEDDGYQQRQQSEGQDTKSTGQQEPERQQQSVDENNNNNGVVEKQQNQMRI